MTRRFGAMIGIVLVLALALTLLWRVYLHHEQAHEVEDEPAVVSVDSPVFRG